MHGGVVNVLRSSRELVAEDALSGVLFATSVNFDISVYEMFLPLAFGGTVIIVDNLFELTRCAARDEVRLVNTVPSLLDIFLQTSDLPAGVRVVNLIGEPLPRVLADRLFASRPDLRLFNLYGPTETTVQSTWSLVDRNGRGPPPIGVPLWNTEVYVLDDSLQPVPAGAVGELWIGGVGVARGYLGRPELTQERFRPNPFGNGRIYRTGDLVKWLPDGQLACLGRIDTQVKINGLRIELGEIEACLRQHPAVGAATVIAAEYGDGRKRLVAYVVLSPGANKPDHDVLARHLTALLPSSMVPATLVWLDAMPLTQNGKVDRKALPAPPVPAPLTAPALDMQQPADETERVLVDFFSACFEGQRPGLDEDYFSIGGDSLNALWIVGECNSHFGIDMSLSALFERPSIRQLAQSVREAVNCNRPSRVVRLKQGRSPVPLVLIHPIGGTLFCYRELVSRLPSDQVVYGIQASGLCPGDPLPQSVEEMADEYIRLATATIGNGPWHLAGWSFGGVLAFAMAHLLTEMKQPAKSVTLLDAPVRPGFRMNHNSGANPADLMDTAGLTDLWMRRPRTNEMEKIADIERNARRIRRQYIPPRIPGALTLLRAVAEPFAQDEDFDWSGRATGGVNTFRIEATHDSIVLPPQVDRVAEILSRVMASSPVGARL
jgi:thioesterase domain-containing protein/acyl carrier protein